MRAEQQHIADEEERSVLDNSRRAALKDGNIVYAEAGSGEPVVFLHGYPQDRYCWRHQFAALAASHRVIAPDWLGWGESSRPPQASFRYWDEVERIGEFLDVIGEEKANFVAHDYGAHLFLGFAGRYPQRVLRMAILNSRAQRTFPLPSWLLFAAIAVMARTPLLQHLLAASPLQAVHRLLLRPYVRQGCFNTALLARYLGWMSTPDGRKWFVRFFQDYRLRLPVGQIQALSAIGSPASIIWGDQDPYNPPQIARELARLLPHATLEWLQGADHYVMEQKPVDVLRCIERLLAAEVKHALPE